MVFAFACSKEPTVSNVENESASSNSDQSEIVLAYSDVETFPFMMGSGDSVADPPGLALEIISKAAERLNYRIRFVRFPNKRVLFNLEKGTIDGAFCYSFKQERLKSGVYPVRGGKLIEGYRIKNWSYYLYRRKDSKLNWDGIKFINLDGAIGANTGYSIVIDLQKMGLDVEEVKTTEQNLRKLMMGRIDGYAAQDVTTDFYLKSNEYASIEKLPIPIATKDYYLLFSKQFIAQYPDKAQKLWKEIGLVRDDIIRNRASAYNSPLIK